MSQKMRLMQAVKLAERAHAGQVDKLGKPYIEHVRTVAATVAHLGESYEVVGLLHDSLEDCDDRSLISMPILIEMFDLEIAAAVDAMTKRPGEDYESEYLSRVMANPIASEVKKADVAHNRSRLHLLPLEASLRLSKKYNLFVARYGT